MARTMLVPGLMGQMAADQTLTMPGAPIPPAAVPAPSVPSWMDAPAAEPEVFRRGHSVVTPRSGLHTFLFFGLIVFVVAAAGTVGMMLWGPEKPVANRARLATNPPAPTALPSLPESADAPTPVTTAEPEPASTEPAATPPVDPAPPKKKLKKFRATKR